MSDTLQYVQWALEWSCALRKGDAVHDPVAAWGAVSEAKVFSDSLANPDSSNGIVGDVFVSATTHATLPERLSGVEPGTDFGDSWVSYPEAGYLISSKFPHIGGADGLQKMCRDCPANIRRPFPVGCVGHIESEPWRSDMQEYLAAAMPAIASQSELAELFVPTTPLWFGLWVRSPLSPRAAGIIANLLSASREPLRGGHYVDFSPFIQAARIAEAGTAKLQVHMPAPGHIDFGSHTVFPHCPRCKAESDHKRWQRKYPTEPYRCKVCGADHSPAAQTLHEPDGMEFDQELRVLLGESAFRQFAKDYLFRNGMSEADAAETVELSEAEELNRTERARQYDRRNEANYRYVQESLYAGLGFERLVDPAKPGEKGAGGLRVQSFIKLIDRCAERGIKITGMLHHSLNADLERMALPIGLPNDEPFDAARTLQQWRSEGCNELFAGFFQISEHLIEAFEKEHPAQKQTESAG